MQQLKEKLKSKTRKGESKTSMESATQKNGLFVKAFYAKIVGYKRQFNIVF